MKKGIYKKNVGGKGLFDTPRYEYVECEIVSEPVTNSGGNFLNYWETQLIKVEGQLKEVLSSNIYPKI